MNFTQQLWHASEEIYQAILEHPFNQELTDGTLDRDRFRFYVQQDALYLFDFGRALSLLGTRSRTPGNLLEFARFAEGSVVVERALHEHYFTEFDITYEERKSPTCAAYTDFLLATCATGSYEEGIAAVLPCFWIYKEVGDHIHERAVADNPYQSWIDTYAGEEFAELVEKMIGITDEVAAGTTNAEREKMKAAYLFAARMEWRFWDSAYQKEQWPV